MHQIDLRPIRFSDAPLLMKWENDPEVQAESFEKKTYCFQDILDLIDSAKSLEETGQLRLIIDVENEPIGTLDFFHWKKEEKEIEVGILIYPKELRGKGIASEVLRRSFDFLKLFSIERVIAMVNTQNQPSYRLFSKMFDQEEKTNEKGSTFDTELGTHSIFSKCLKNS
ncbi:MAG: GNAT family N-acetyltransferase [Crocinitomicaceae bacterium]|jgi:RimJ/RimL family protein N-acetyltransferase|nr:GNAT family N-acetyltransferase [Crocinitomicaceae bacterium]